MIDAGGIAKLLAVQAERLAADLLPDGHREGPEWRAGSVYGEAGSSLGVHLIGDKRGVWCDFATDQKGDCLDLVKAALGVDTKEALTWARQWLGIDGGYQPKRRAAPSPATSPTATLSDDPDRWRRVWDQAKPIAGTTGSAYLAARGLTFNDPDGRVLRFAAKRARRNPAGELECHPAMLALLSDILTVEPCGIINVYLLADGSDRIRDTKGKTVTCRAKGACVMLDEFDDVTMGLTVCEGVETGIALHQAEQRPVWSCGGASILSNFPLLGGIEALTIAADTGDAGQEAASKVAERWHAGGREAFIVTPPAGDWAGS